jgi:hypothetical protein
VTHVHVWRGWEPVDVVWREPGFDVDDIEVVIPARRRQCGCGETQHGLVEKSPGAASIGRSSRSWRRRIWDAFTLPIRTLDGIRRML